MENVYPLDSLSIDEAMAVQFKLIDEITKEFPGLEMLSLGDLGVVQPDNIPSFTKKAQKVIANFFDCEDAVFVRGAGTGALRLGITALISSGDTVLVHDAPIYPTTKMTLEMMGVKIVTADYNNQDEFQEAIKNKEIKLAIVQHTRQKIDDSYDYHQIIKILAQNQILTITDDNYAALKVKKIGCQTGATLSTFSVFKLQGPTGVGLVVGSKKCIDQIRNSNYSGGSQVQGYEAHEALRAMVNAPVSLAISAKVCAELVSRINEGELKNVKSAFIVNAQSKVAIIKLQKPNAKAVIKKCEQLGCAPHPVGAESKYEIVPMVYRVSSTFKASLKEDAEYYIRVNPMRSGVDTILRILKEAIK